MNSAVLSQIPPRMKQFVNQQTVAGAVTLVAHGGELNEFDAAGMADIEAGHPMQKDTIFQIMSMTKPFTAVGIMMLAEEGKLALRDPVEQYLPEFHGQHVVANVGPSNERLSIPEHPITIRDLMTHTAGIQDFAPAAMKDYRQLMNMSLDEVVRRLAAQPLLFQPGTQWSYSSPGIEILGRLIEVCSGQKYEDFIASRILRPLGMKDTFFYPPADKIATHRDGLRAEGWKTRSRASNHSRRRSREISARGGVFRAGMGPLFDRRRPAASLSHDAQ